MKEIHFPEKISGPHVTMRKNQISQAAEIFACVEEDRERLAKFLPWVPSTTQVKDEMDFIQLTHDLRQQHKMYDYGLFLNEGTYIGNIGVHNINWLCDRCELGYWILGRYEGKGLMREAVTMLTHQAFQLGFNRVEILCAPENQRSATIPKSLGFAYEGRLAQHMKDAQGNYRDSLVFARIKDQGGL